MVLYFSVFGVPANHTYLKYTKQLVQNPLKHILKGKKFPGGFLDLVGVACIISKFFHV